MKVQSILLLFAILTIALFTGCSDDKKNETPVDPPVTPITIKIKTDTTAIALIGAPEPVRLLIHKEGYETLTWNVVSKPDWVELSKTSGNVEWWPDTLFISSIYEGMEYGTYNGSIKINSNGGNVIIPVSLTHYPPQLLLAKTLILFDRDFYQETFQIQNNGGNKLFWHITKYPSWISVSDTGGTSTTARPGEVVIKAKLRQLDYGNYEDTMNITTNAGNSEVVISLTYERVVEIYPGIGGAKIDLGECYDNIKKIWGPYESSSYVELQDKRLKHTIYYNSLGFEFDFVTNNVVLFGTGDNVYMRFSAPYDGWTEKYIGLDNTIADVIAAYGEPDQDDTANKLLIYNEGIGFEYNSSKTTIKKIHIFPAIEE